MTAPCHLLTTKTARNHPAAAATQSELYRRFLSQPDMNLPAEYHRKNRFPNDRYLLRGREAHLEKSGTAAGQPHWSSLGPRIGEGTREREGGERRARARCSYRKRKGREPESAAPSIEFHAPTHAHASSRWPGSCVTSGWAKRLRERRIQDRDEKQVEVSKGGSRRKREAGVTLAAGRGRRGVACRCVGATRAVVWWRRPAGCGAGRGAAEKCGGFVSSRLGSGNQSRGGWMPDDVRARDGRLRVGSEKKEGGKRKHVGCPSRTRNSL